MFSLVVCLLVDFVPQSAVSPLSQLGNSDYGLALRPDEVKKERSCCCSICFFGDRQCVKRMFDNSFENYSTLCPCRSFADRFQTYKVIK